ncbi:molecular chaperone [Entomohabitans teleogrylli]|uniref:fimbrial biogenesis chaperone n=1 Tax=Entomohabitans teleogrylli TaxID=1384589 RepID=UPI0008FCB65A|nr:molecular chaperone [Entomohabitans teleogrylli]
MRYLLTLLLFLSPLSALSASSVLVWPVYQTIAADQKSSALWLENRGSTPTTLQVRVLAWQQQDGRERYADQNNAAASPPFATVPPGQRQLVRLVRLKPVPAGQEQAYRIIIDEIPATQPASAGDAGSAAGVQLRMRYVLPLFMAGEGLTLPADDGTRPLTSTPALRWQITQSEGKSWLTVHNQGQVHARLSNVFWGHSAGSKTLSLADGYLGYVLPGQTMRWPLPAGKTIPAGQTLFAQLADNSTPVALTR